jgi:hypothetical protein
MPAKKTTILAADDDPQLLRLITRNLQNGWIYGLLSSARILCSANHHHYGARAGSGQSPWP